MNSRTRIFITPILMALAIMLDTRTVRAETFHCSLTNIFAISDAGELEPHPLKDVLLSYQATVDTNTGIVVHPEFGNSNYETVQVVDHGSKISAFKVIALSMEGSSPESGVAAFRNAVYFEVKTYAESIEKPFLAMTNGYITYGVCK